MQWYISSDLITVGSEIGRGSFGVVRRAKWRHTEVAIKVLYKDAQAEDRDLFEREVAIMATLHHPNIVQFLGFIRAPELALVLELFPDGSIENFVLKEKPSKEMSLSLCWDMALAIEYMHSRTPSIVIHRDIKPANFMLTPARRVKLCDFGVAREPRYAKKKANPSLDDDVASLRLDDEDSEGRRRASSRASQGDDDSSVHSTRSNASAHSPRFKSSDNDFASEGDLTSNCGTARFMAPEVSSTDSRTVKYSSKADIFSLALVYYFVWERALPALPDHTTAVDYKRALASGVRPAFQKTPKHIRALIEMMWAGKPLDRPTAHAILEYQKAEKNWNKTTRVFPW